jgi:hypothetical protein
MRCLVRIPSAPAHECHWSPARGIPIGLVGTPPLSTRFTLERLAGPDLTLPIAGAALTEDITRSRRASAGIRQPHAKSVLPILVACDQLSSS